MGKDELVHPKFKNELNLNTIVLIVGLVATIGGAFYTAGQQSKRVDEIDKWRSDHEVLHREVGADIAGKFADVYARIRANDAETRRIENLSYRTTVLEQGAESTQQALGEVKEQLNTLSADIRVMREILTRMEKRRGAH
jgi:hypothetical protein